MSIKVTITELTGTQAPDVIDERLTTADMQKARGKYEILESRDVKTFQVEIPYNNTVHIGDIVQVDNTTDKIGRVVSIRHSFGGENITSLTLEMPQ